MNSYAEKILKLYTEKMREFLFIKNKSNKILLFGSEKNLVIWLNKIISRETVKLKLGTFSSHSFRHAVGFHLLRGGCDIRYIQEILGHKELSTTQIYTKVDKEDLRKIIDSYHPRIFKGKIKSKNEKL